MFHKTVKKFLKNRRRKAWVGAGILLVAVASFFALEVFVPRSPNAQEAIRYDVKSGTGTSGIATELQKRGIINSGFLFNTWAFLSGNQASLQAGLYEISPNMSVAAIIRKLATGDVAKNKITILPGWDIKDIATYVDNNKFYAKNQFLAAAAKDYSREFSFLENKPKGVGLDGYMFPDTYYVPVSSEPEDFIRLALKNTDKKITADMRKQMAKDKRSVTQIIIMASILEKEVATLEDKKMVAGILWKRLASDMPLQVDSTINYITDKNNPRATLADLQIDSYYNTYKYAGLPLGPISNPGLDSITAAVYPVKNPYWFYLSASANGRTIYSKTYEEHKAAIRKHLTQS